jgi:hypothetical protein
MNTRTLKLAVIAAVTLTGGYFVFAAFARLRTAGATITNLPEAIAAEVSGAGQAVNDAIQGTVNDVKSSLGIPTNPDYVAPAYVKELSVSNWSASTKAMIRDLKRARGIKVQNVPADFIGWKVFSNGTIISPAGEYLMEKEPSASDAWAFSPVWFNGATDWNMAGVKEQWQLQPSEA